MCICLFTDVMWLLPEHLSSVQIGKHVGMRESMKDLITARRLRWPRHVARMDEDRIPKRVGISCLSEDLPMVPR